MSDIDYVRGAASKYGWMKYYSVARPASIGAQPVIGFMDFINYDSRTEIQTAYGVVRAWAELYYNRELTEQELRDYEIVRARKEGCLI